MNRSFFDRPKFLLILQSPLCGQELLMWPGIALDAPITCLLSGVTLDCQ